MEDEIVLEIQDGYISIDELFKYMKDKEVENG